MSDQQAQELTPEQVESVWRQDAEAAFERAWSKASRKGSPIRRGPSDWFLDGFLAARVQVERPDDDAAAIVEWFVRMQANAEASYIIEAAAEAIANADGWHWHDEDYESPDPKWQPTDKAEYRETARKAFAAARSVAAARLPERPDEGTEREWEAEDGEPITRAFHDAYERLAPTFGYKTREASAVAWEDVPAENKGLMRATIATLLCEGVILPGPLAARPVSSEENTDAA